MLISVDRVVIKSQRYSYTQKSYDSILCRIIKRLVLSICSLKMPRRHLASTLPALLVLVLVQASFPTLTASSSISNNLHGQHFENLFKVQGRQDLPGGCSIHFYDDQKLDHFSEDDTRVFSQRYTICPQYATKDDPPAILYIGGERPQTGDAFFSKSMSEVARVAGGVMVALEHRYYGLSYPKFLPDASTENLRYLSSEQALADMRQFILYLKDVGANQTDPKSSPPLLMTHSLSNSRWVVTGGSYPGNLAAWMKLKHGDIISGAVAHSAPVLAQIDFHDLYQVLADNLKVEEIGGSQSCFDFWDNALYLLASRSMDSLTKVPPWFRPCDEASNINRYDENHVLDMISSLVNTLVGGQNYMDIVEPSSFKNVRKWCQVANEYSGEQRGTWKGLYKLVQATPDIPTTPKCVSDTSGPDDGEQDDEQDNLKWPITDEEQNDMASRLWSYQTCHEFGYFQPYYGLSSSMPAWKYMTLFPDDNLEQFDDEACRKQFNMSLTLDVVEGYVERTNEIYGGRTLQVENVTFVSEGLDPWKILGILPEGVNWYNYCPDGNKTYCTQNSGLGADNVLYIPLGSHGLSMSSLTPQLQYLNPELAAQWTKANAKIFSNVRSYLMV